MYTRLHPTRQIRLAALLLAFAVGFTLPNTTLADAPTPAPQPITRNGLFKPDAALGDGGEARYQVDVRPRMRVMIGVVNLGNPESQNNFTISNVDCPNGRHSPIESTGGVVYCTPGAVGNSTADRNVNFTVTGPAGVFYGVFVQPLNENSVPVPSKTLPSDTYVLGTLAARAVMVYAYPEQPTATVAANGRLLLQVHGSNVRSLARLYADNLTSGQLGVNRCSATVWWENKPDRQVFPAEQSSCVLNNGDSVDNTSYLVVINYGDVPFSYRSYLMPGNTNISASQDSLTPTSTD